MKKCVVIALALLMAFSLGCKKQEEGVVDIVEFPTETQAPVAEPAAAETTAGTGAGMVAAGSVHSLGARTDGTVVTAGHNTAGQNDVGAWTDVVAVAAGDAFSVGVKADGAVLFVGSAQNGEDTTVASWAEIENVAAGSAHIVGLKKDGTVVAAGSNTNGQCDVTGWTDIKAVAAAGNHSVGLKDDGTVVVAGDVQTPNWTGVSAIATNGTSILGVSEGGTALTTGAQAVSAWTDLVDIAACDAFAVGVKKDGTVVTDGTVDVSAITDAVSAAGGTNHVLVMKKDGSTVGLGSNDDFQTNVSAWRLRPYTDGGYLVGFAPAMTVERVTDMFNTIYNTNTTELKKEPGPDGAQENLAATDIVYTGVEAFVDGATLGQIVIRGDVTGDGQITEDDATMIDNHILGNVQLTPVKLAAAGIYKSVTGEIMTASADAVRAYMSAGTPIPQFASVQGGHTYDEKINTAKQTNDDVTGWITLPGTNIDFPIMVATKDYHYNNYTWDDKKDEIGSIYMYYNEARQGQFYAFTGHNNRKRAADKPGDPTSMFHQLHHIYDYNMGLTKCAYEKCGAELTAELPDLKTYAGRVWTLNILGEEGLWEVFSAYATTKDTSKTNLDTLYNNIWFYKGDMGWSDSLNTLYTKKTKSRDEIREWIDKEIAKSEIKDLNVTVGTDDKLLTVVTCGTDSSKAGERLFFFLHKVG